MKTRQFTAKTSLLLLAILVITLLFPTSMVYARLHSIGNFGANCHDFSVDIQLSGLTNDGAGLDKFRYQIIDGSGAVLYQEEATRPVGESGFSEAINLPYQTKPTMNPVTFIVQDVDNAGHVNRELDRVRHDVECLKLSGLAKWEPGFFPKYWVLMTARKNGSLYDVPDGSVVGTVGVGWVPAVYRTADNRWIATFYNSYELQWVPAAVVSPPDILPIRPTRIERSARVGEPTGVVISVLARVHTQPSLDSQVLGFVGPWGPPYYLEALARTPDSQWLQVRYNGSPAWVKPTMASFNMLTGDLLNLPIIPYPANVGK